MEVKENVFVVLKNRFLFNDLLKKIVPRSLPVYNVCVQVFVRPLHIWKKVGQILLLKCTKSVKQPQVTSLESVSAAAENCKFVNEKSHGVWTSVACSLCASGIMYLVFLCYQRLRCIVGNEGARYRQGRRIRWLKKTISLFLRLRYSVHNSSPWRTW